MYTLVKIDRGGNEPVGFRLYSGEIDVAKRLYGEELRSMEGCPVETIDLEIKAAKYASISEEELVHIMWRNKISDDDLCHVCGRLCCGCPHKVLIGEDNRGEWI